MSTVDLLMGVWNETFPRNAMHNVFCQRRRRRERNHATATFHPNPIMAADAGRDPSLLSPSAFFTAIFLLRLFFSLPDWWYPPCSAIVFTDKSLACISATSATTIATESIVLSAKR